MYLKNKGLTGIRTRVTGLEILGADHCTMRLDECSLNLMRMNDSIAKVRNRSLVDACAAINVIVDGILWASLFLFFLRAHL